MWTDEVKRHGLKHASFRRAVWRFIRTRIFVGMSVFVVCLIMGLLGPVRPGEGSLIMGLLGPVRPPLRVHVCVGVSSWACWDR